MSFVVFVSSEYFGYMLGDKRVCDRNGKVLDDNVNKVRRLNENLIWCAAGDETQVESIWNILQHENNIQRLEYSTCFHIIENELNKIKAENHTVSIGICSIVDGYINAGCYVLENNHVKIDNFVNKTEYDVHIFYLATGLGGLDDYFFNDLKKYQFANLIEIKSAFYKTLKLYSATDYTINTNFNTESIIRRDVYDERKNKPRKTK